MSPSHEEQLIALVDQRVRLHQQRTEALGSCTDRDPTGPGAQILFDGATVAVPVKVAGHVSIRPGMRCALQKFGTEWIVMAAFAVPQLGEAEYFAFGPAGAPTTNISTFADITGLDPFTFIKLHDYTWVDIDMGVGAFATVAATAARWALRFTQTDGDTPYTSADLNTNYIYWNTANQHLPQNIRYPTAGLSQASGIPAGTYSVQIRWRRTEGSGTVQTDTKDLYHVRLNEVVRADSPYV